MQGNDNDYASCDFSAILIYFTIDNWGVLLELQSEWQDARQWRYITNNQFPKYTIQF
jgi:hypothetical protein